MASEPKADPGPDYALTVASQHQDFAVWRQGRSRYAAWIIDVDIPSLRAATARIRNHLEGYLLPGYGRQPHITLRICGFPGSNQGFGDDFTPAVFTTQIKSLELARLEPFAIEIGAPQTFTSAAFFSVRDKEGGVRRARTALGSDGPGERDFPFVPHLTFGLYRRQFSVAGVMQRMGSCPDLEDIQLKIGKLALMTYDASVITGPLTSVCEFDFERQALRVLNARAMEVLLK